jgi:hypothetical protein
MARYQVRSVLRSSRSLFSTLEKSIGKPLIGKYQVVPEELFRIGPRAIKLREWEEGKYIYDYKLGKDGMILPATGDSFIGPNGMSLRPFGINFLDVLSKYKSTSMVTILPKGLSIPNELILLHEFGDHFSLQTAVPAKAREMNSCMSKFIATLESVPKAEFLSKRKD